jgi:hypothetical protein
MFVHKLARCGLVGLVSVLLAACGGGGSGGGSSGGGTPPAAVAIVEVQPAEVGMTVGEATRLQAIVKDAQGNVLQGRAVVWSSSNSTQAAVDTDGTIRALSAGAVQVTASVEGREGAARVTVQELPATVARVAISGLASPLEEGDYLQLQATAYDAVGNVVAGRVARWTSSSSGIAEVSQQGRVTALRPGTSLIRAQIDGSSADVPVRVVANHGYQLLVSSSVSGEPERTVRLDISDPASVPVPMFPGRYSSQAVASPDGRRIAVVTYSRLANGQLESRIYVVDPDGSNLVQVGTAPGVREDPAWSPDGTQLAYSYRPQGAGADVWVANADGSQARSLTSDQAATHKRSPAWSPRLPDGSYRIAYVVESNGTMKIWSMRADGTAKSAVTTEPEFADDEPAWSPDGSKIAFTRSGAAVFGDLYVVASVGGVARALMPANPLAFGQFSPAWSPDGRMIAFTSKHGGGDQYQVWTVWSDGTRLAQRTFEAADYSDPAWFGR